MVDDEDGNPVEILRLQTTDSTRILGYWFSPSGQEDDHHRVLKKKVSAWAMVLKAARLTRVEIMTAYTTQLSKAIGYSLPVTTFNKEEANKIIAKPIEQLLYSSFVHTGIF